jgi:hypothetical protein
MDKKIIKALAIQKGNLGRDTEARALWDLYYDRKPDSHRKTEDDFLVQSSTPVNSNSDSAALLHEDLPRVIHNHTGYGQENSANWEHDDTGSLSNYSGCADIFDSASATHDGWTEGYDY